MYALLLKASFIVVRFVDLVASQTYQSSLVRERGEPSVKCRLGRKRQGLHDLSCRLTFQNTFQDKPLSLSRGLGDPFGQILSTDEQIPLWSLLL